MSGGRLTMAIGLAIMCLIVWALIAAPYRTLAWFDRVPVKVAAGVLAGLLVVFIGLVYHYLTHIPTAKKVILGSIATFTSFMFLLLLVPISLSEVAVAPELISIKMSDLNAPTAWTGVVLAFLVAFFVALFVATRMFEVWNECDL